MSSRIPRFLAACCRSNRRHMNTVTTMRGACWCSAKPRRAQAGRLERRPAAASDCLTALATRSGGPGLETVVGRWFLARVGNSKIKKCRSQPPRSVFCGFVGQLSTRAGRNLPSYSVLFKRQMTMVKGWREENLDQAQRAQAGEVVVPEPAAWRGQARCLHPMGRAPLWERAK